MNLSMSDLIDRGSVMEIILMPQNVSITEQLEMLKKLPSAEPLTEEDYIELRDRFGEYVEFIVRDMISGKGERWKAIE